MRSKIKKLIRNEGKTGTGFIFNPEGGRDIVFFEGDLFVVPFSSLKKGDEVEFGTEQRKDKRGVDEIVARGVKLVTLPEPAKTNGETDNHSSVTSDVVGLKESLLRLLDNLKFSSDWARFEDEIFLLLRLAGIHALYQFDKKKQKGQPDGLFLIHNLVVIYDCTLDGDYVTAKRAQIENFVNGLNNKSLYSFNYRRTDGSSGEKRLTIQGKTKQVWIVTTGENCELFETDEVKVREISAQSIVDLVKKRLVADKLEVEDMANLLAKIAL